MMDPELRLTALSKLVGVQSDAVEERLSIEFRQIENTLREGSEFEPLSMALKTLAVLGPRFHGAVLPLATAFVQSVRSRMLTDCGQPVQAGPSGYRSASRLMKQAIDAVSPVRYVHTAAYTEFLLSLSQDGDPTVSRKATQAIEAFAEFDLDVFYSVRNLGAKPQADLISHLAGLNEDQLRSHAELILRVVRKVLSSSMEGRSWTYDTLTIRQGGIVAGGGVAQLRKAAIALGKRLYPLEARVGYRRNVLRTLGGAARRERHVTDPITAAMLEDDAIEVLGFMRDLVPTEALPLIEAIEHDGYWNFHHAASNPIREAALQIRDAVLAHAEYQIYKQLIGFEGIFGDWEQLRSSEAARDYTNSNRTEAALQFVEQITDDSQGLWRERILKFAETESDDLATFPVFYEFLRNLGQKKPGLALELLTRHEAQIERFMIPLIGGLWLSARQSEMEAIVWRWIAEGRHLSAVAKSFFGLPADRFEILKAVVERSAQLDDRHALVHAMGVSASLQSKGFSPGKTLFMCALRALTARNDASWLGAIWYSRDFRAMAAAMDADERSEVLRSLTLPELNYEAEEILCALGDPDIAPVLDYLERRLQEEREREQRGEDAPPFEAIPSHLEKLGKLLANNVDAVMSAVRRDFESAESSMFPYRSGPRLLQAIFPEFDAKLQSLLMKQLESGTQDDIHFALAVIRSYDGQAAAADIFKRVIGLVPERSRTWDEVAAAIEQTGIVMGAYGFAEAFERKRDEVALWKDDGDARVRAFAAWFTENIDQQIVEERRRADESLALRKYKFGAPKDEQ